MTVSIPPELRYSLREFCSDHLFLRTITAAFEAAGFSQSPLPDNETPSGQRRTLVTEYYYGADWSSRQDAERFVRSLNFILSQLYLSPDAVERLLRDCRQAGLIVDDRQVRLSLLLHPDWLLSTTGSVDMTLFERYCRRIMDSVYSDPDAAVGSAKELVEAVAKYVLRTAGCTDGSSSMKFPQLVKAAIKALGLAREDIPEATKGADAITRTLAAFNQIVDGLTRLRALYGTGHGRDRAGGLQPRHARLAVGAAITLSAFMLETLEERTPVLEDAS